MIPMVLTSFSAPLTPLDNTIALKQLEKAHKVHSLVTSSTISCIWLNHLRSHQAVMQVPRLSPLRRGSLCLVEITPLPWQHFALHTSIGAKSRLSISTRISVRDLVLQPLDCVIVVLGRLFVHEDRS